MISILDKYVACQTLPILCRRPLIILSAVWRSIVLSDYIMEEHPLGVEMSGIITRCRLLLQASTMGLHILMETALSSMACHGGEGPVMLSQTYLQQLVEEKTMEELPNSKRLIKFLQ